MEKVEKSEKVGGFGLKVAVLEGIAVGGMI